MMTQDRMEVKVNAFLILALDWYEWQAPRSGCFVPGERDPGIHWREGWEVPKSRLDVLAKRKIYDPAWNETPVVQTVASYVADQIKSRRKVTSLLSA